MSYRIFKGSETQQIDLQGRGAYDDAWYFEPSDYSGDALWSRPYADHDDAAEGAAEEVEFSE